MQKDPEYGVVQGHKVEKNKKLKIIGMSNVVNNQLRLIFMGFFSRIKLKQLLKNCQ